MHPGHRLHTTAAALCPALLTTAPAGSEVTLAFRLTVPRSQTGYTGDLQKLAIHLETARAAGEEHREQRAGQE